ncbi:uncharacterized protein FFFS_13895 [Fusarium fujikuroi]|jgi:hypothetical protein
MQPP